MRSLLFILLSLSLSVFCLAEDKVGIPTAKVDRSLYFKGDLKDFYWASALKLPNLLDVETSEEYKRLNLYCVQVNDWYLIGASVAEKGQIVAREYMNGENLWFDDNLIFTFKNEKNSIEIITNPLGAYIVSEDGKESSGLLKKGLVVGSSFIHSDRWTSVVAIHNSLVDKQFDLKVISERQHRGFESFIKAKQTYILSSDANFVFNDVPLVQGPRQALADLQFIVGQYRLEIPEKEEDLAAFGYNLKGASEADVLRPEFQKTTVSIAANEKEIGVYINCSENSMSLYGTEANNVFNNDVVEIFIGPDGSQYLQFSIAPFSQTIGCHRGKTGGRRIQSFKLPESAKIIKKKTDKGWSFIFKISVADILKNSDVIAGNTPITNQWNMQIIRYRSDRPTLGEIAQESFLVSSESANAHCPARFARLNFQTDLKAKTTEDQPKLIPNLLKSNSVVPGNSIDLWRKEYLSIKNKELLESLSKIKTKENWEAYANDLKQKINQVLFDQNSLPSAKKLKPALAFSHVYNGVEVRGELIMSRLGLPVALTVFKSVDSNSNMPALVMVPAHHTGRNSLDLYITGYNFAKSGGIAVSIDTIGSGERAFAPRWNHKNHQRFTIGQIMRVAGQEVASHAVAEIVSVVDYLLSMKSVDKGKIALIGGVAGGGDVSGLAAALDTRITVNIPFNFSHEKLIVPWMDYSRTYNKTVALGLSPWVVSALVAPRKYIQAEEFEWSEGRKKSQEKSVALWSLYDAKDNVSFIHGWEESHATHFNYMHRVPIYVILNKWWNMKLPETRESESPVSFRKENFEVFQSKVGCEYMAEWEKSLNKKEISFGDLMAKSLKKIKPTQAKLNIESYIHDSAVLPYEVKNTKEGKWNGFDFDGFVLEVTRSSVKEKLALSGWVLKPKAASTVLTICISRSGKARFLYEKSKTIVQLLEQNQTVMLLDLSGVGETEISELRLPESQSAEFAMFLNSLGSDLIQWHLSDMRTVFDYIEKHTDYKELPICLWGAEFMPSNGKSTDAFKFNETNFRQASPAKKYLLEANGPLLAMFGALIEKKVKVVSCENYLVSFESMLTYPYCYITTESLIDSVLEKFDVPDILAAIKNKNIEIKLTGGRDAQNRVVIKE